MTTSYRSTLRFLAASLLASGLSFASIAEAINIQVDPEGDIEDQPTVTLDVQPTDTIGTIKARLETTDAGYPPELQILFLGDKELKDSETVEKSGIKEGATLVLKMKR